MYHSVELKSSPEVRRIVLAAFPSYRKHKATISEFHAGQNVNSYWDGGSKSEYAVVSLETFQRHALPHTSHPYFDITRHGLASVDTPHVQTDHVGNVHLKMLPENCVLVEAGTFCGKPATAHVYVQSANLTKLLGS